MPMTDPFTPSAFSLTSLTAAINNLPYQPMLLGSMFEEQGLTTTQAAVDIQDGVLSLVEVKPRGAPGKVITGAGRRALPFLIPHLPEQASILADEVQGVRAFGMESQAEVLQTKINERLAQMRRNIDYTIESHRLSAIMGNYVNANGDSSSLFTAFGVVQQTKAMGWHTSNSSAARTKCTEVLAQIEDALGGIPFTGVRVLCGATFWASMLEDKDVKATYLNTQMAADLRRDPRLEFDFNGITWTRYRGTLSVLVGASDAYAIPQGVPGLLITRFAPANYNETVNTVGLPYYAKGKPKDFDKGWDMEAQSNPLNLVTRPAAIIKLTVS